MNRLRRLGSLVCCFSSFSANRPNISSRPRVSSLMASPVALGCTFALNPSTNLLMLLQMNQPSLTFPQWCGQEHSPQSHLQPMYGGTHSPSPLWAGGWPKRPAQGAVCSRPHFQKLSIRGRFFALGHRGESGMGIQIMVDQSRVCRQ